MNNSFSHFVFISIVVGLMNAFGGQDAHATEFLPSPVRAGLSIGAAPLGGLALNFDTGQIVSQHMSLGVEIFGIQKIGARALLWENPKFMNGLHGGGKFIVALGNSVAIEPGVEAGWSFRFKNRIDAGIGINLLVGNAVGGNMKLTFGYLIQ